MDSVTHHITATGPDGTALEVLYGYADRGRRMLECRHCAWREQITGGGARGKALAHLSQAHGAGGAPAMAADTRTLGATVWTVLACFGVAAAILLWAVSR
ncbi:hypothetical protein PV341_06375 [Streptomyces sp. PA03-1a]|nr:hypothetical protein [Streptomyces sp. PA03-1a]MDX2812331.1 hypothetical protein [Streptomyces sp. PA03-5A]